MKALPRVLVGMLLLWLALGAPPAASGEGVPYVQSPTL